MNKTILIFFLIVVSRISVAQSFGTVIDAYYASGNSIIETKEGNYIIGGETSDDGYSISPYIIQLDRFGKLQWTKSFGHSQLTSGGKIISTRDGGYLLSGRQMIKFDSSWNTEWYHLEYQFEMAGSAIQASDGGFVIVGTRSLIGGTYTPYTVQLIKVDEHGKLLWKTQWRDNSKENLSSIAASVIETESGYYVCGYNLNNGNGLSSTFVAKISLDGNIIWNKIISLTGEDIFYASSIVPTVDGGFIIGGTVAVPVFNDDIGALKVDTSGNVEWFTTIDGLGTESFGSLINNIDNTTVLVGSTSLFLGNAGLLFVTLDPDGELRLVSRVLVPQHSFTPNSMLLNSSGVPVITGALDVKYLGSNIVSKLFALTLDSSICFLKNILVQVHHPAVTIESRYNVDSLPIPIPFFTSYEMTSIGEQTELCSFLSAEQHDQPLLPSIVLSPNPLVATQSLMVSINGNIRPGYYLLTLLDAVGKRVYSEKRTITTDDNIVIPTSNLSNGLYTVELLDANTFTCVWRGKVVKIK